MKRKIYLAVLVALLAGCARDEKFTAVGTPPPVVTAPPPTTPTPPPPATGGGNGPTFNPSLPPGQTQQYVVFLPIDYFFRQYGYQAYWQQIWNQWQQVAYYYGTHAYDFNTFWFEYCPQVWYGTDMWNVYQYMDQSFYGWAQPQVPIQSTSSASVFWQYYYGYGYGNSSCQSCSYY